MILSRLSAVFHRYERATGGSGKKRPRGEVTRHEDVARVEAQDTVGSDNVIAAYARGTWSDDASRIASIECVARYGTRGPSIVVPLCSRVTLVALPASIVNVNRTAGSNATPKT